MSVLRWSMIICLVLAVEDHAMAVGVRDFSLKEKVRLSDIVVIGHVVSVEQVNVRGWPLEYSRVQVDKTLKGTPPDVIDVLSKGSIAEMDPACCEVGRVYLFFLEKTKNNRYESVIGRFGIYLIPSEVSSTAPKLKSQNENKARAQDVGAGQRAPEPSHTE